jgi:hypothetical protein
MASPHKEGTTMEFRRHLTRRVFAPTVILTALLTGALAAPANAAAPSGSWHTYLEQPKSSDVKPVSATVLSGNVSNAQGLTSHADGATTLTVTSSNDPATILLDYGEDVEGSPYIDVKSYNTTGASPTVSLAFTEAKGYLRTPGSSTLAAAATVGATTLGVQPGSARSPLTFAAGDKVTVGSPAETDTIVPPGPP